MAKKMLIDATHAEETRVVVVDGTKVEEFDFETVNKRQLAGNIYLAKVTRVEPSLQAAFVDYGGNRHGFLAFAEIHPDYYQIPAADRQALLEEEKAYAEAVAAEDAAEKGKPVRRRRSKAEKAASDDAKVTSDAIPGMELVDNEAEENDSSSADEGVAVDETQDIVADAAEDSAADASDKDDSIESVADEDVTEEIRIPKKPRPRRYKIQEVIKVRQIMLVQVVKEERGNKGAALTTYLSLAGRYCVLMPNTARGGGISRKITSASDRKKLKDIASDLKVPQGAGLIIRTAGSQRTRTEIKRDYEYLMRLWEQIRELTFNSTAPSPIYEEGDLIKRTIRDLYSREIDEVLVEGERGYRVAKDFMKMIMPSHARNVKHYHDPMPLFARYQVEGYLGGMFNPVVQLKSGGYIVIGVTEALVAIDVNSGRATKEGSIEDTATKTNLEAADEISRQLRLRDLAGLIVIDFIDMDERKNNLAVEKRLKDRLKTDRARIQVGKISGFGLLEMSRQRLRPGMLESTTQPCAHCHGTGLIRSDDSLALTILRAIEEEGTRKRSREVLVKAPVAVANFLMNGKREHIALIEARYGMAVRVEADPQLISPDFAIEKFKSATRALPDSVHAVLSVDASLMAQIDEDDQEEEIPAEEEAESDNRAETSDADSEGNGRSKRRRRRRRRGGKDRSDENGHISENGDDAQDSADGRSEGDDQSREDGSDREDAVEGEKPEAAETAKPKSRSRSRSRRRPQAEASEDQQPETDQGEVAPAVPVAAANVVDLRDLPVRSDGAEPVQQALEDAAEATPETAEIPSEVAEDVPADAPVAEKLSAVNDPVAPVAPAPAVEEAPAEAIQNGMPEASDSAAAEEPAADAEPVETEPTVEEEAAPPRPKRRGWWSIG
ncbi:Rne/Rng family ribonuclease [Paracoccus aerodenitrificans]|uniref:Rne/Rng family ribonuclease n=1 Tax=Paracoccus aerodenitrificans TaxID=3017781 RepID=UPI0022F08C1A|nr:ribonuclease E/G [Paracoccus aerodenitrificans]WBU64636.1 ribonuclease E/G [Paracoccus aerodenitrificans]